MTLGYNPETGHFVGSWIGSMATHHWVYDGALDAEGRLVLEAWGPAFDGNGMALFRDIITMIGPDERLLTALVQGGDGEWTHFMSTRYHRVHAAA